MASDASTVAPLSVGQVIQGFRLEERTHRGGMASLWRVSSVAGNDALPLIMKVPRLRGGDDPTTVVGFEVEQMILPTLSGPHVPKFVARGDFAQQPCIVMERIAGSCFRKRLDAARLTIGEVVKIGTKNAIALHDLHRHHVWHLSRWT